MEKLNPYFGQFGGMFVPQILVPALKQLEAEFLRAQTDPEFLAELSELLTEYAGRPTPLTLCRNLTKGFARRDLFKPAMRLCDVPDQLVVLS